MTDMVAVWAAGYRTATLARNGRTRGSVLEIGSSNPFYVEPHLSHAVHLIRRIHDEQAMEPQLERKEVL